ncbi:MAG: hypothetical protein AAGB15_02870 [Pseudomonadota bacterium]
MAEDHGALEAAILAAHEAEDREALARLYGRAADLAEADGDIDACCFFLTYAYVFALQADTPEAPSLHARLMAYGREE